MVEHCVYSLLLVVKDVVLWGLCSVPFMLIESWVLDSFEKVVNDVASTLLEIFRDI